MFAVFFVASYYHTTTYRALFLLFLTVLPQSGHIGLLLRVTDDFFFITTSLNSAKVRNAVKLYSILFCLHCMHAYDAIKNSFLCLAMLLFMVAQKQKFLLRMLKGYPKYGVSVNAAKTVVNFNVQVRHATRSHVSHVVSYLVRFSVEGKMN